MKLTADQLARKSNFNQAKLLIVEDNDDHWLLIQSAIRQCLIEVTVVRVSTPQQALDRLDQWQYQEWEQPKLILLDLYLPRNSDGWQLLEQIKQMPAPLSHVPIVIFSSSEDNDDILKAYQLGASSYLIKPMNAEEWLFFFRKLRSYWWETATLPRSGFSF
ncbi:response regulator [Spirosoma endbachense]|uniref:Response regulator n=1 Tax=Spirosoma endbachense TaxID=2666025 RepID=A0A6P1VL90_9BACT|nr:response regulator [Spirosoma endbachense]QHV93823.1 response regulator [Spirosoma endbachense]